MSVGRCWLLWLQEAAAGMNAKLTILSLELSHGTVIQPLAMQRAAGLLTCTCLTHPRQCFICIAVLSWQFRAPACQKLCTLVAWMRLGGTVSWLLIGSVGRF